MVIPYEYTRTVCTIRVRYEIRVRYTTGSPVNLVKTLIECKQSEIFKTTFISFKLYKNHARVSFDCIGARAGVVWSGWSVF